MATAAAIILAHNHVSDAARFGALAMSALAQSRWASATLVGIAVRDHLMIGDR